MSAVLKRNSDGLPEQDIERHDIVAVEFWDKLISLLGIALDRAYG
jgi:hypothetical protein